LLRSYHEKVKDGEHNSHHYDETNITPSSGAASSTETTHSISNICQFQVLLFAFWLSAIKLKNYSN
jgi:hypothetical protein